ncbi:hypothetical protein F5148DRAFT_1287770 [Russula earlei]|uniref:Uncharacterized protein n=1 Tax=Russula earlei TaxID=71964 RepID=A0ACC0U1E9_9AGAM|nr:hypothetical protein F5148DRAFT_1287770 [Russula earlei]
MAFASTDHDLDLESQYISSPLRLVRGPGMCPPPTGWNPPETEGIFKFAFRDIPRLEVDTAQPTFPLATEIHPADTAVHAPGQAGQVKDQAEPPDTESGLDPSSASNNQSAESSPGKDISKPESQDFDSGANTLWTLFKNETQSHDEARIQRLKDDMDGVLIFAGLFSAALTSFIIDSKGNLKVNPADQMVYYLQQNVAMLAQISTQISSIAPQIIIPSSLPPPYPAFNASSSDIRVNAFWFMSLIFSLSAALLAILVQQWVRNYMHVFQRYSDPLKSARLRQYLHEGSEKWYMPVVAEALPGLLHVSLFLFFVGLGDFVLNINITVGQSTIVPIGLCGSLYVFAIFAPVMYPQSPYQNSFSGLVWYLVQRLHGRKYKDRDGSSKSVSANMSQGQMQLAMEETNERMKRDQEAIRWLVDNLTEETEMESLVAAIPGSFNAKWGRDVWKRISEETQGEDKVTNGNRHAVVPLA